jgi:hypothetical protein
LLATPELAETALAMGYNDSIGTLLALAAFLVRGRSALLAGLLVGCSMSCKLMPGLVAATIVFPPDRWKSYAAGMAAGLLPTVLFLAWDPTPSSATCCCSIWCARPTGHPGACSRRPGWAGWPALARWASGWPVRPGLHGAAGTRTVPPGRKAVLSGSPCSWPSRSG